MKMSEQHSFESILEEMLAMVPGDLDKREGSIIYDALSPIAWKLYSERIIHEKIRDQAFVHLASGEYLDMHGVDNGTERNLSTQSKTILKFTGQAGQFIPKDTIVGGEDIAVTFKTESDAAIGEDGVVYVPAVCTIGGTVGNVPPRSVNLLLTDVPNIETVENAEVASGGVDEETDENLRNRLLLLKRNSEKGGSSSDYERWAVSVPGVEYIKVIDMARGLGTVDVVIGGNLVFIDEIVNQVNSVIARKKHPGVDVVVRPVKILEKTYRFRVIGLSENEALSAALSFFKSVQVGTVVYNSKLISALINAGAEDVELIYPLENLELEADCIVNPTVVIE